MDIYHHRTKRQKIFLRNHISRIEIIETQVPNVIGGVQLAARDTQGEPTHTLTLTDFAAGPRGVRKSA